MRMRVVGIPQRGTHGGLRVCAHVAASAGDAVFTVVGAYSNEMVLGPDAHGEESTFCGGEVKCEGHHPNRQGHSKWSKWSAECRPFGLASMRLEVTVIAATKQLASMVS